MEAMNQYGRARLRRLRSWHVRQHGLSCQLLPHRRRGPVPKHCRRCWPGVSGPRDREQLSTRLQLEGRRRGCFLKRMDRRRFVTVEAAVLRCASPTQPSWTLIASLQGRCLGTEVIARKAQGRGDRGALRSCCKVRYRPGLFRYSRVVADPLTPSSALPSRIGFLDAATASPTMTPTSPGDTNLPTASPTPSPTYSPDGTSALHPVRLVGTGLPRSACRTPHGL
jgi:hypothetical protein